MQNPQMLERLRGARDMHGGKPCGAAMRALILLLNRRYGNSWAQWSIDVGQSPKQRARQPGRHTNPNMVGGTDRKVSSVLTNSEPAPKRGRVEIHRIK